MEITFRPELKQTLAPDLMQFLKLLQLPTLELQQLLRHELEINPFLEEIEDEDQTLSQDSWETSIEENPQNEFEDKINWNDYLQEGVDLGYPNVKDSSLEFIERVPVMVSSFEDFLLQQLRLCNLSPLEMKIGEFIIGNLDENGYLVCSLNDIAEKFSEIENQKIQLEKIEEVLKEIQSFEPSGVGARTLQECLIIQLDKREDLNLIPETVELAKKIIKEHFHEIENKKINIIAKALEISREKVERAISLISSLDPKPGSIYSNQEIRYVFPDIIVERVDGEYIVFINDRNIPRLRISHSYREILKRKENLQSEDKKFVQKKLNSARFMVRMLSQRRATLMKVMEYIVNYQKEFFDHGISHLKPMTMKVVSEAINLHESTVSRVVNNKYALTPQGIYELSFFFSGKICTANSKDISNRSMKTQIAQLINSENKKHPLTDQKIIDILKKEGFFLARRTVAKYREEMGILPARMRKEIK